MSSHLLYGPEASSFGRPVKNLRYEVVYANLQRVKSDDTVNQSPNDAHDIWLQYAKYLSAEAKYEIPTQLPQPERMMHPAFGNVSRTVGALAVTRLAAETSARAELYSEELHRDVTEIIRLTDIDERRILHKIDQSWRDLQTSEAKYSPPTLAQLAGMAIFNTTLRQLMQEESVLLDQFQTTSAY